MVSTHLLRGDGKWMPSGGTLAEEGGKVNENVSSELACKLVESGHKLIFANKGIKEYAIVANIIH